MEKKRSIAALAGETAENPAAFPTQEIPVNQIEPSPANKRRLTDNHPTVVELAESIAAQGLLQEIIVRPKGGNFELVAGERRWRAYRLKKWATIPAKVRELSDQAAHDITLTENLQREDLSPIEESESIQFINFPKTSALRSSWTARRSGTRCWRRSRSRRAGRT